MIDVRADIEGLRIAAGELLAESMMAQHRRRIERQMAGAGNLERALAATRVKRSVADGYYAWAVHLFHAEQAASIPGARIALQAFEARGLAAIAAARQAFDNEHPQCPACGLRLLYRGADSCGACGEKLKRAA